jgi:cytochrome c oxidase subunit 2
MVSAPRWSRGVWRLVGLLGAGVVLGGCRVPGFSFPQPADRQGQRAASLWGATELVALAVGVLVWGLIAFVVLRYRHRRGTSTDAVPSQRAYNVPLEVLYTTVPLVIVAGLFIVTTAAQGQINAVSSHPDVRVEVTAFQWGWRFHYPIGDVTTVSGGSPPLLVLPLGKTVEIDLSATDVVHAFYVPGFLFQRAAVPGSPTRFDLDPTRLGMFRGQCATFCGLRHYEMLFNVRVVTPDQFDQWLASGGSQGGSP